MVRLPAPGTVLLQNLPVKPPFFLPRFPMLPVLLTSAYLPPVQYVARLYAAPCAYIESYDHYVKQTYRNRCVIAGPDGRMSLTLPVEHGDKSQRPRTRDIRLSDHGDWRHLHTTALRSAYEGSPYFEYYAPDLLPIYERPWKYLVDFNAALLHSVLDLLDLHPDIRPTTAYADAATLEAEDLREIIRPKVDIARDSSFHPRPYYQVFAGRTGFLPNLSIVDLLFNMGPESRLVLRDSLDDMKKRPKV